MYFTNMKPPAKLTLEPERSMKLLYEFNQQLLMAKDSDTIVKLTNEYLIKLLDLPVIFHIRDPIQEQYSYRYSAPDGDEAAEDLLCSSKELEFLWQMFQKRGNLDEHLFSTHSEKILYIPAIYKSKLLGIIGIPCKNIALDQTNLYLLHLLAGQAALALESHYLSKEQKRILNDSEKERMNAKLLSSISHDLRAPLAGILATCSTILEQKDEVSEKQLQLLKDITDTTSWLIRMVENILTVTRISKDEAQLNKVLEAAEEVVAQSLLIVRKRYPGYNIQAHTPNEILMVPMDAILITQVLINLLENAIKNSSESSNVSVILKKQSDSVRFEVRDSGIGIAEELLPDLFGIHAEYKNDPLNTKRGSGIGLSICKAIVKAHGGSIEGHNNRDGGASFSFLLPL